MNKQELGVAVSDRLNISRSHAQAVVGEVLDEIGYRLAQGEKVSLAGFGIFEVVQQAPRKARNPRTGEALEVPAKAVAKFRPASQLKAAVAGE